jgi:ATP-dependent DNA helicase PIF1
MMGIIDDFKKLLGINSIDISELNRRATRKVDQLKTKSTVSDPLDGIVITEKYKKILALLEANCPVVFVTGNAGTGKSTLIRYLKSVLNKKLVVVAPTGVAALNASGVTIHSFFRLPPKIHEDGDIKLVYDRKLYQKLELLIIDEVSMVRGDLLDSIDKFLRKNRSTNTPFGGVQLLLIGDLFQLPPVVPKQERDVLSAKGYTSPYFFSSLSLQKTSMVPVELTYPYRQDDRSFIDILNRIRVGDDLEIVISELNRRCSKKNDRLGDITLTCTNNQADQINREALQSLPSKEYSFKGEFDGQFSLEHDKLPSPIDLRLKVGSHVMFTKNDEQRRWVNGTIGNVLEINQRTIRVELVSDANGTVCDVLPAIWNTYKYSYNPDEDQIVANKVGQYMQYPLMLAWAVTIHKSQGKTLNNVSVDLGSGAFATGQVYVALSRCRSVEGIHLTRPIRKTDVKCDPVIKRFYLALAEMTKEKEFR